MRTAQKSHLLATCALTLALPALAQETASEPQSGGTVFVHVRNEQGVLNPALRSSFGITEIAGKIMEPLIDHTAAGYEGVLATEWSSSGDGLAITFRLRDGVFWHDGEPFTCDDVAFSAMEFWKPLLNYSSTLQANLESVDCPDPLTAVFNYSEPMPLSLLVAAMPELGYPVPRHLYEGTKLTENPTNLAPVGTGPFVFSEYERGQYIIAVRNEDYWRGEQYPYLDRIIWRYITDGSAAAAAFEAGELQVAGFNTLPVADMVRLGEDPRFDMGPGGYEDYVAHSTIEFNLRNPILADVRVRRAIYHALDLQFAIDTIWRGYASPGHGPIPSSGGVNYTGDVPEYAYDVGRANALLDEAGYPRDGNGIRFTLRHRAAPYGEFTMLWGDYFVQAMKDVGIKVELVTNDSLGFLNGVYRDHDFDTANGYHQFRADPAVSTTVWLRSGAAPGTYWSNQFGYESAEMDRLIDEAAVELDPARRTDLYHRIQQLEMTDLPVIFAIEHPFLGVTDARLMNQRNTPRWQSGSWYDLWLAE